MLVPRMHINNSKKSAKAELSTALFILIFKTVNYAGLVVADVDNATWAREDVHRTAERVTGLNSGKPPSNKIFASLHIPLVIKFIPDYFVPRWHTAIPRAVIRHQQVPCPIFRPTVGRNKRQTQRRRVR